MKNKKLIALSIKYADTIAQDLTVLRLFESKYRIKDIFSDFFIDKDHEYLKQYKLSNIPHNIFNQLFVVNPSLMRLIPKNCIFLGQYNSHTGVFFNEKISEHEGFKHLLFFNIKEKQLF